MKSIARKLCVLSSIAAAILLSCQKADAAPTVLWVNDNAQAYASPSTECDRAGYATIQAAINAAAAGDTVNVCPGFYLENVEIVGKPNLTLISTGGAAATTIKAALSFHVVSIRAPHVTLEGFTIVPAGIADPDLGVNVAVEGNASAQIARNVIRGGRIGINLGCSSSGSTVYRNVVRGAWEEGINIDTCELRPYPGSSLNSVHHNTVCGGLFPYSIAAGPTANNNAVHHNIARWISVYGTGNLVHNNTAEVFQINAGNLDINNAVATLCP